MQLPNSDMTNDFYRAFEDRHRGTRELIKSRLRVYVPFVEPLTSIYEDCKAIDLGCGRGEWLEILRELGFDARGVDLDDGMLAACRDLGLPAEQGEAIALLRTIPDESLAVVSGFHIAEHIAFADLQTLVQETLRVLRPAGLLILETPNPENIVVGTSGFYTDPTHQRPLPPLLLSFLPEHYGFARTKILRLQEPSGLVEAAVVKLIDVLGSVSLDYAVVAQKKADTEDQSKLFDDAFQRHYGVELGTLAMRYENGISGKLSLILSQIDRSAEFAARAHAAEAEVAQTQQQLAARDAELAQTQQQLAARDAELNQTQQEVALRDAELAQTQQQLAARDAELNQTQQEVALRDAELAQTQQQLAARDAEIERLNAHIARLQGEWSGASVELARTQQQLSAAEAQIEAFLSSTSWRLTAPIRAVAIGTRDIINLPARAKMSVKIRLKPHVVRAGAYLGVRPDLKAKVLLALQPFPRLHARLARAAMPVSTMPETPAVSEQAASLQVDQLTPSARRVYQDLLDARAAAKLKSGGKP